MLNMISEEQSYQMSKSALNLPVGLLIRSPKRRLGRLRRHPSNGSIQSKLSSVTTRSAESALQRESNKRKARQHNQGLAAVFGRGAPLQGAGGSVAVLTDGLSEMPSRDSSPSILKIFGSAISQGAHYKSVLATIHSSANEIVKEALERYGLEDDTDAYLLCEVVGYTGEDLQWRSACSRVVGAEERPLLLQAMWKPAEGFSRRFEIQKRATEEQSDPTIKLAATTASGKLAKSGSRVTSLLMELGQAAEGPGLWRSLSELELPPLPQDSPHTTEVPGLRGEGEETESNQDYGAQLFSHAPPDTPYLLLLQGYSHRQDFILYLLNRTTTVFGHCEGEKEVPGVDLQLHAPDILPLHCRVLCQEAQSNGEGLRVLLEPLHGAPIMLNGAALTQETQLCPGDLVGFGRHYLFLYKDPTGGSTHKMPPWLTCSSGHQGTRVCLVCGSTLPKAFWEPLLRLKDPEGRDLSLLYELEHEDQVLEEIFASVDPRGNDPKLTPAFLLCLCIQHSAVNFHASDFHRLLLQIASHVQTTMWEMTKELTSVQPETPSSRGQTDSERPQSVEAEAVMPDIQPLVLWLANSLELLHFIQHEVLGPPPLDEEEEEDEENEPGRSQSSWQESTVVLEEVVMFTFQQSVYHLTKTLYVSLPSLLDSNPFSESGEMQTPKAVGDVVTVLQETLGLLSSYQVHEDISRQLFAYLFFFTNTSLFNVLMERGVTGGFYQWSRGVQIRANLDLLMDWIQGVGMADLAADFFQKLSVAVNLLATPRETLLQASWSSLRGDFEQLSPAQLHHMLQHYHSGRACPAAWSPVPEEAAATQTAADILESFDGHPPLRLPRRGFHLERGKRIRDAGLTTPLCRLQEFIFLLSQASAHLQQTQKPPSSQPQQRQLLESPVSQEAGTAPGQVVAPQPRVVEATPRTGARSTSVGDLSSCEAILAQKLRSLELQGSLQRKGLALDPSCLLTPPNTPQGHEPADDQQGPGENQSLGGADLSGRNMDEDDDVDVEDEEVFSVKLQKGPRGLGLALVDGMATPMKLSGIYIRSVVPDSPAGRCPRLGPGDRILAVNGQNLVGMEFGSGRDLIRTSGDKLSLLVAKCIWKV